MVGKKVSLHTLNQLTDEQILALKLCEIDFDLDSFHKKKLIKKLQKELQNADLDFMPHIWVSDDWFSPDGLPGFAIPFYLFSPKLIRIQRKIVGRVEGATEKSFMMLLRHETGHALDNAFHLRKSKKRQKLFGTSSQPYPIRYKPQNFSRNFVHYLGEGYAQAHPDEDWAETFAVWLDPQSQWQKRYTSSLAREKLDLIDTLMSRLVHTKPINCKTKTVDSVLGDTRTLRQYFDQKEKELKVRKQSPVFKKVKGLLSTQGDIPTWLFIHENRDYIKRAVAKNTLLPHYKIDEMISDVKTACKNESYYTMSEERKQKKTLKMLIDVMSRPQVSRDQSWVRM